MKSKSGIVLCGLIVLSAIACVTVSRGAPPQFAPDSLPVARVGDAYEVEIRVSENDTPIYSFDVTKGTLPAGLELIWEEHADTAKISGIPEGAGTFTFTLSIACLATSVSGESGEQEYSIVVEE